MPGKVPEFDRYLLQFDYQERKDMKIQREELLQLYAKNEVQLVDIRFREEYEAWHLGFGDHIPLNELPQRLDEIDRARTILQG